MNSIKQGFVYFQSDPYYVDRDYADTEDFIDITSAKGQKLTIARGSLSPFPTLGEIVELNKELTTFYPVGWIEDGIKAKFRKSDDRLQLVFVLLEGTKRGFIVSTGTNTIKGNSIPQFDYQPTVDDDKMSVGTMIIRDSAIFGIVALVLAALIGILIPAFSHSPKVVFYLSMALYIPVAIIFSTALVGTVLGVLCVRKSRYFIRTPRFKESTAKEETP